MENWKDVEGYEGLYQVIILVIIIIQYVKVE